jgi:hypothetical protein
VPASSAETCFSSTTDPQLRSSASSSLRMVSNSRTPDAQGAQDLRRAYHGPSS